MIAVTAMAILLTTTMGAMLYFSRKAVKEEAVQSATTTLEGVVQSIDNIMLSVEQTTGNILFSMMTHLNERDRLPNYARKMVETNPYVAGAAIAFKEGHFADEPRLMVYVHREDSAGIAYGGRRIVSDSIFGQTPYTTQTWFTRPLKTGRTAWINTLADMKDSGEAPIITYSIPLYSGTPGHWEVIGVIGIDISLTLLSDIVAEARLSENSYCTMLDKDGSFIVHPLAGKLLNYSALMQNDPTAREAAKAMLSGKPGYRPFKIGRQDFYVFYQPMKRQSIAGIPANDVAWSAGIVYPEDDIFGPYRRLSYHVAAIAIASLLLSLVLISMVTHRQLRPLLMLTEHAQRIAQGNLSEPIPDSEHQDEIGRLQDNFRLMQQSLATNIGELEQLTGKLKKHGDSLSAAYHQAKKADRMKTAFLHHMTNQMLEPADRISHDVKALCHPDQQATDRDAVALVDDIQQQGNYIADLLKNLLNASDEDFRKEVEHA